MKNIITLSAVIIVLMIFPLQYAMEQHNNHNLSMLQVYVNNAKEKAKIAGYFTPEIIDELKTNLLNVFDNLNEADIIINVTTTPKYRKNVYDERELIHYRIEVPIKKVLATPTFWGLSEADNQYKYVIENYTTSELLP